jgi:putative phosphoribosyl transferase
LSTSSIAPAGSSGQGQGQEPKCPSRYRVDRPVSDIEREAANVVHGNVTPMDERQVEITTGRVTLVGDLKTPVGAPGVVLFAHGSGSGRHSPRNRAVAAALNAAGLATLLMDLLTAEEERIDMTTGHLRFDIGLLAIRVITAIDWLGEYEGTRGLAIGCFGASTGAGAALVAAAERPQQVAAVVSRGGRPDLANGALTRVQAPTLLIVGGNDQPVIELNRVAMAKLNSETSIEIVPGATHLFEEPGALEVVARLAAHWFSRHLRAAVAAVEISREGSPE